MTTTRTAILAMAAAVLGATALTSIPAMANGPGPMVDQQRDQNYDYGYGYGRAYEPGGCWVWTNGGRHWSLSCGTSGALYYGEPDYYSGPQFGFAMGDRAQYRHHRYY